jgi:hypothetical protein
LSAPDPDPVLSIVAIQTPTGTREWGVCDVCAAAVQEFILEFSDDVRSEFRNQDETYRLRNRVYLQKKLPEAVQ